MKICLFFYKSYSLFIFKILQCNAEIEYSIFWYICKQIILRIFKMVRSSDEHYLCAFSICCILEWCFAFATFEFLKGSLTNEFAFDGFAYCALLKSSYYNLCIVVWLIQLQLDTINLSVDNCFTNNLFFSKVSNKMY